MRQLFWRKFREAEDDKQASIEEENRSMNVEGRFNSDLEQLIFDLDTGYNQIKTMCKVVMYNDVKIKLKNVAKDLARIKKALSHTEDLY
jgi:hypothetical protein